MTGLLLNLKLKGLTINRNGDKLSMAVFRKLIAITLIVASSTSLFGCRKSEYDEKIKASIKECTDIKLDVNAKLSEIKKVDLEWVELDQLDTYNDIRNTWDLELDMVKFGKNSKNGPIYIDTNGDWTGNNTLYNAFQNKEFVKTYWKDAHFINSVSDKAIEKFSDITNKSTGIIASVNAYYNILPVNTDGTSGLYNTISRKEAMAAIYRCDTPVKKIKHEDDNYTELFGEDEYNKYTYDVEKDSYFKTVNNSLNPYTYNSPISRAEAVYIIMHRYFEDELNSLNNYPSSFGDCVNGGDIFAERGIEKGYSYQVYELQYSIKKPKVGITEELYKALYLAYNKGIIGNETRWNDGILFGEYLSMILNTYEGMNKDSTYPVNAKLGNNK